MGLLGAGTYESLMIDSVQVVPYKVEGEPRILVRLTDVETQDSITDFLNTSNDAWDKFTQQRLKAYGWDPAANNYLISQLHNSETLIGTMVGPVYIKEEVWSIEKGGDGKTRPKIKGVGEFSAGPADPAMLAAAEAKLRARLAPGATTRKAAPKKAAPAPVAVTTPIGDDDESVPF